MLNVIKKNSVELPNLDIEAISTYVTKNLKPKVRKIDDEFYYPSDEIMGLGNFGAFSNHLSKANKSGRIEALKSVQAMSAVSEICMSTGFCVWCHDACGWYLENTHNNSLREKYIYRVGSALQIGATGLSNPMKNISGIEKMKLIGERVNDGYIINGSLPWISNLGQDHIFGAVFQSKKNQDHKIMGLFDCKDAGIIMDDHMKHMSMDGTGTYSIRFKDSFISDEMLLADPAPAFMKAIRPGFIYLQMGMGIGLVRGCAKLMEKQRDSLGHINNYLELQPEDFYEKASELESRLVKLESDLLCGEQDYLREILLARIDISELSLKAAETAMLHCGARGFVKGAEANRKVRESYFVAIVTPAIKHLKKEVARIDGCLLD